MLEKLENELLLLKNALKDDPRIILLNQLEEEVNSCPRLIGLSKQKEAAIADYSLAISCYPKDGAEVKKAQTNLYKAKLAIDEDPLSVRYSAAFIEVRDLYMLIDDIIFSEFRKKTVGKDLR